MQSVPCQQQQLWVWETPFLPWGAELQATDLPLAQDWIFILFKKSCREDKGKYIGGTEKIVKLVFIPRKS